MYYVPDYIEACLLYLSAEIDSVLKRYHNTFETDIFLMREYEDCACKSNDFDKNCKCSLPNFKVDNFEIEWYKYLGRDMIMNEDIQPDEFIKLFDKCLKSIRRKNIND